MTNNEEQELERSEDEALRSLHSVVKALLEAYDAGELEMNSREIGEPEVGIPMHPWHEEWLHYARAAIAKAERLSVIEGG